jgi:hypothetical protein
MDTEMYQANYTVLQDKFKVFLQAFKDATGCGEQPFVVSEISSDSNIYGEEEFEGSFTLNGLMIYAFKPMEVMESVDGRRIRLKQVIDPDEFRDYLYSLSLGFDEPDKQLKKCLPSDILAMTLDKDFRDLLKKVGSSSGSGLKYYLSKENIDSLGMIRILYLPINLLGDFLNQLNRIISNLTLKQDYFKANRLKR